ncbi:shikimate kinase [Exiguobacterium acetylicum]|uniref:shikimate kinase n=1 Tax=Exiguobacterium acetylicum TaxID=41170 RepID=UPI001EE1C7F2|nr:shikimate kinase [Exiguobacterium acetylicum]UKS57120.1 hypothetical protein K6T22_05760 [Exiguobacterium acetylicum]
MRIQIIGGSGTGKSTLGAFIGQAEQIPWIDTDHYLWKDTMFTEKRTVAERFALYEADLASHNDYIVSGSVFAWHPDGFTNRDLLVFLSLDETVRMERLIAREKARYKDFTGYNEFLDWCRTYHTATDPSMIGTFAEHQYQMERSISPVLILDASLSTQIQYQKIIEAYNQLSLKH